MYKYSLNGFSLLDYHLPSKERWLGIRTEWNGKSTAFNALSGSLTPNLGDG